MKPKIIRAALLVLFLPVFTLADDMEMYVTDTYPDGTPYLHIVLDSSPTAYLTLCTYGPGESCSPPFMTQEVYDQLRSQHKSGDAITRSEVFYAILARLFARPEFDRLNISLLISDREMGARVLNTYTHLGGLYKGRSGAEVLVDTLVSLPVGTTASSPPSFQPKDAFYMWYSYINDSQKLEEGFDRCSKFFSVVMATESSFEDGTLDSAVLSKLAMPSLPGQGFAHFLDKLHSSTTDLLPFAAQGVNYLEKTWLLAPKPTSDLTRDWSLAGGAGAPLNIDKPVLLEKSLARAFSEALGSAHTYVATRLSPITVDVENISQDVFVPMFEPRPTSRWSGNLKKFKLIPDAKTGVLRLVDKNNLPAFVLQGDNKGQIQNASLSYWSTPQLLPPSPNPEVAQVVDGPDVTRGGAGQKIPGFIPGTGQIIGKSNFEAGSRQVFVEPKNIVAGEPNALTPLNGGDDSLASSLMNALEAQTLKEAKELIRWGRGLDVDDEDADGNVAEARPWIMGAAIHSRPVTLNYGAVGGYSEAKPNVRVFLGTNDGIFHAFENTRATGVESGREVFAFYPEEGLSNIKRRRNNSRSSVKKHYGVDGGIATLVVDSNGDGNINASGPEQDEAYVYFGMRRGGYSYYALDVSDPSVAPSLRWKITRSQSGTGFDHFKELGLSFSKPVVGKVQYGSEALDVVIFAGGYNGGWNSTLTSRMGKDLSSNIDVVEVGGGNTVSTGNALFIVNARTGELVWKAIYGANTDTPDTASNTRFRHSDMVDSIPSAVSALRTPAGIIDRLYVGDTGGVIWRVDLPVARGALNVDHRKEHWFVSMLAKLGGSKRNVTRRFFHAPDVVRAKEDSGELFDGVLISSGDRAHPNRTDVLNYHFYIKDTMVVSGADAVRARAPVVLDSSVGKSAVLDRTACLAAGQKNGPLECELPATNGWAIKLARPGEKSLSSPLVEGGRVFFTSYVPPIVPAEGGSCALPAGTAYITIVNLQDGSASYGENRIYPLGSGAAAEIAAVGDMLLFPLGGLGNTEEVGCEGAVCRQGAAKLHKIYWRDAGIDEW